MSVSCPVPLDSRTLLAPMAGITDLAYRTVMRRRGSAASVTELISAEGLIRKQRRSFELAAFLPEERPVGIQLFGARTEAVEEAIQVCQELGADFVDMNFGCPVPKVVKKGGGAAATRDPVRLEAFLSRLRRGMDIPLTIKIRAGWDQDSINAVEVAQAAEAAGCAWVAIHGRTRAQGYTGYADWDLIRRVTEAVSIPVIGNGDILDGAQVVEHLEASGCAAVMIGRGALRNPWVCLEARRLLDPGAPPYREDFVSLLEEQRGLLQEHTSPRHTLLQLKKFSMWYSFGFPGSRAFRRGIFAHEDPDAVFEAARAFFEQVAHIPPGEKDRQPFLKGGHG